MAHRARTVQQGMALAYGTHRHRTRHEQPTPEQIARMDTRNAAYDRNAANDKATCWSCLAPMEQDDVTCSACDAPNPPF